MRAAPRWGLVVFDEAHHLSAWQSGAKVRKTENYKLAEALKAHTRDLLLLSAMPHQGNHFQFWMLTLCWRHACLPARKRWWPSATA